MVSVTAQGLEKSNVDLNTLDWSIGKSRQRRNDEQVEGFSGGGEKVDEMFDIFLHMALK